MPDDPSTPIPDPDAMTADEFNARLATDDAFVAHVRAEYERALAVPPTPETEKQYPAIRASLAGFKAYVAEIRVMHRLPRLKSLLNHITETNALKELPNAHAMIEEMVDLSLDANEPLRTHAHALLTDAPLRARMSRAAAEFARGELCNAEHHRAVWRAALAG